MNVIHEPGKRSFGKAFATGINAGVTRLAENKLKQFEDRQALRKYTDVGYSPEEAAFIQNLPEKSRYEASQALAPEARQHTQEEQEFMQTLPETQRADASRWLFSQRQRSPQKLQQQGIPEQMSGMQEFLHQAQPNDQAVQQQINQQEDRQAERMFGQQQAQQQQGPRSFGEKLRGGAKVNPAVQARIDRSNAPYNKVFSKAYENAEEIHDVAKEMQDLWNTGKVASGAAGSLQGLSIHLQNNETQEFNKLSKQLAQKLSSQSGLPTKFKIQYAEEQKPSLNQNRDVQGYLINGILKDTSKIIDQGRIREDLIAANDYNQPDNLETRVAQAYRQQRGQPREEDRSQQNIQPSEDRVKGPAQARQDGESLLGWGVRQAVRGSARAAESIAGGVGDIAAAALGLGNYATGGATPTYSKVQEYLPISAPTSEQIKDTIGKISGGYTDPQSGAEEAMDGIVGTVAAIFGPGKLKTLIGRGTAGLANPNIAKGINKAASVALPFSGTVPLRKAAAMGLAGAAGAQAAKTLGAGATGQSLSRLGFMLAAGGKGTSKAVDDLMTAEYESAKKGFSGKSVKISGLKDELAKYSENLDKRALPHKAIAQEIVNEAKDAVKDINKIDVSKLIELKQDLNKWYSLASRAAVPGERHLPKETRAVVGDLISMLKKPLEEAVVKYPEAGKSFTIAEDIFRGKNNLWKATEFLKDHVDIGSTLPHAIKGSALLAPAWYLGGWAGAGGIIPAAFATKHAVQFANLIRTTPQAAKIYQELLLAAANENKQAVARNLALLDKELYRYEKKAATSEENK